MKIKLQGKTVELSKGAENSLIEFMREIVNLMPYEQFNQGQAYIYAMDSTQEELTVEFVFTLDSLYPQDKPFEVVYGGVNF